MGRLEYKSVERKGDEALWNDLVLYSNRVGY
jgi:hypothetical protein